MLLDLKQSNQGRWKYKMWLNITHTKLFWGDDRMSENYSKAKKKRDKNKPLQRYGSKRRLSRKKNNFFGLLLGTAMILTARHLAFACKKTESFHLLLFHVKGQKESPPVPTRSQRDERTINLKQQGCLMLKVRFHFWSLSLKRFQVSFLMDNFHVSIKHFSSWGEWQFGPSKISFFPLESSFYGKWAKKTKAAP